MYAPTANACRVSTMLVQRHAERLHPADYQADYQCKHSTRANILPILCCVLMQELVQGRVQGLGQARIGAWLEHQRCAANDIQDAAYRTRRGDRRRKRATCEKRRVACFGGALGSAGPSPGHVCSRLTSNAQRLPGAFSTRDAISRRVFQAATLESLTTYFLKDRRNSASASTDALGQAL